MAFLGNRIKVLTATVGTGTVTLGAAFSNAFCTFAEAGITNGQQVAYLIEDGLDFEIGLGTYTSAGTTLSRDTVRLSKIGGTAGTTKITLSGTATVAIVAVKEDLALLTQEDQVLVGGAAVTPKDLGNLSGLTITPDPGDRPIQKITNNGAGTIAPGSVVGTYILIVKNTTGAGAITTSGWQDVSGEPFDTTTTSEFVCHATITGDLSALVVNKVA